jgi:hypothetical protein
MYASNHTTWTEKDKQLHRKFVHEYLPGSELQTCHKITACIVVGADIVGEAYNKDSIAEDS